MENKVENTTEKSFWDVMKTLVSSESRANMYIFMKTKQEQLTNSLLMSITKDGFQKVGENMHHLTDLFQNIPHLKSTYDQLSGTGLLRTMESYVLKCKELLESWKQKLVETIERKYNFKFTGEDEVDDCESESNSSEDEAEITIASLLSSNLSDYDSNEDEDCYFSSDAEGSVDSLEYRSTENEESEAPFTEEEISSAMEPLDPILEAYFRKMGYTTATAIGGLGNKTAVQVN